MRLLDGVAGLCATCAATCEVAACLQSLTMGAIDAFAASCDARRPPES